MLWLIFRLEKIRNSRECWSDVVECIWRIEFNEVCGMNIWSIIFEAWSKIHRVNATNSRKIPPIRKLQSLTPVFVADARRVESSLWWRIVAGSEEVKIRAVVRSGVVKVDNLTGILQPGNGTQGRGLVSNVSEPDQSYLESLPLWVPIWSALGFELDNSN